MTALQRFERLSPTDRACWATLAVDLRTGGQRQQRIDRAEFCEYRARRIARAVWP